MIIISPSILSCDFSHLADEISRTKEAGAEYLHIDVMDGLFVPNITLGPVIISSIRKLCNLIFDVHLMIVDPIRYVDDFVSAGADILTIHSESCENIRQTLEYIRSKGIKAGLSIKPKTDPELIRQYLPLCDIVLVMTVEPGFGGQSFIPEAVDNISKVKKMSEDAGLDIPISVDGGITAENAGICAKAGATVFAAGSSVYKKTDYKKAVSDIRSAAENAIK